MNYLQNGIEENAIYRINKDLPSAAIEDALDKLRNFENAELIQKNETFMNYLQNGIEVRYFEKGEEKSEIVYIEDALDKLRNFENAELIQKNETFMNYLQNGIEVRYFEKGEEKSEIVYIVDYEKIHNNSFIIANQWTFIENSNKRPDIIIFLNGLPVVIMELKSPSREETDFSDAYRQLQNYKKEIPSMFIYKALCVITELQKGNSFNVYIQSPLCDK